MNLGALILISISVGLDNSAVAIAIGLSGIPMRSRIKTALTFGIFEALMPIVGLWMGSGVAHDVGSVGRYAGALLLILTGGYAFWHNWNERLQPRAKHTPILAGPRLILTAFALCIDNLVVGFALSISATPVVLAGAVMVTASVLMTLLALELGNRLGSHIEQCGDEISAMVLILVGVALATGVLG